MIQGHFLVRGKSSTGSTTATGSPVGTDNPPPATAGSNHPRKNKKSNHKSNKNHKSNHVSVISNTSSSDHPNISTTGSRINDNYHPMIITDTPISFWGGIDPMNGMIIDTTHPLYGTYLTSDHILCIPSSRGSCTTSQVVLELILNQLLPRTIIVRDFNESLLCIGHIIAHEFFPNRNNVGCQILCIGPEGYHQLLQMTQNTSHTSNSITSNNNTNNTNTNTTAPSTMISSSSWSSSSPRQLYGSVTSSGQLHIRTKDGTMLLLPTTTAAPPPPTTTTSTTITEISSSSSSSSSVPLSDEEQSYLDQCTTAAERMALKVIFQYAHLSTTTTTTDSTIATTNTSHETGTSSTFPPDISQPPSPPQRKYIPIQQAHIDGCTYIGPGGLKFVQQLFKAGGRVKVPTTLNAVSTDRRFWSQYQVPTEYARNAIALGDAYLALGCQPTFTCAPYLLVPPLSSSSSSFPQSQSQLNSEAEDTSSTTVANNTTTTTTTTTKPVAATTTTTTTPATEVANSIRNAPISILFGQDIAWGESNAVVYANSVLGARTEKYADYLDICCAIAGIVPKIGVHHIHQRKPTVWIDGTKALQTIQSFIESNSSNNENDTNDIGPAMIDMDVLFPILGHLCGRLSNGQVPILTGFDTTNLSFWNTMITTDHLKSFCAAFGTTASSPLIHIAGITPEAKDPTTIESYVSNCNTKQTIELHELYDTFQRFNTSHSTIDDSNNMNWDNTTESIELVALGNPHLSSSECTDLARIIQQLGVSPPTTSITIAKATDAVKKGMRSSNVHSSRAQTRIIACISRDVYAQSNPNDLRTMHEFGIEFIYDTCWCMILDEPIIPHNPLGLIMTNSGKYAHYGPGLTNRQFRFGSMYDCIYAARFGHAPIRSPVVESNTTTKAKESSSSSSSSSSISRSMDSKHAVNSYLSFLTRPQNHPISSMTRRYYSITSTNTTTTRMATFSYISNICQKRIMSNQRMCFTTATTAVGKVVRTVSLILFKQFCQ